MPTATVILTAVKLAILAGWIHLILLLVRSMRPAAGTVYTFRLLAALLGFGSALEAIIMLIRGATLDGLLPEQVGRWPGWFWLEAPALALLAICTALLVRLMVKQRYLAIDEALREIRRLRSEVGTDPLTGLSNRASLDQRLQEIALSGERLSLIFIDVDDFKRYNDAYGHLAGDQVLRELAALFQEVVRRSDLVARYGGEEFVIVLPGAPGDAGRRIAEQIRRQVEGQGFAHRQVTLSAGIASAPADATNPDMLLKMADVAMYRAKADGGNRVYACDSLPQVVVTSPQEGETVP